MAVVSVFELFWAFKGSKRFQGDLHHHGGGGDDGDLHRQKGTLPNFKVTYRRPWPLEMTKIMSNQD